MAPSLWHACMAHGIPVAPLADEKELINALLDKVRSSEEDIRRVVTLSPRTDMARNFHLRNGAKEIAVHVVTANFEYEI